MCIAHRVFFLFSLVDYELEPFGDAINDGKKARQSFDTNSCIYFLGNTCACVPSDVYSISANSCCCWCNGCAFFGCFWISLQPISIAIKVRGKKNSETQLKISAILIQPTLLKFGWWKLFGNWNTDYSMLLSCKNSQSNSYWVLFHSLKIYSVLFTRSFSISWKCCIQLFHLYTCAIIFIAVYRTIYNCCCGMLVMPREQLVSTIV